MPGVRLWTRLVRSWKPCQNLKGVSVPVPPIPEGTFIEPDIAIHLTAKKAKEYKPDPLTVLRVVLTHDISKKDIRFMCEIICAMRSLFSYVGPIDITWYPTHLQKKFPAPLEYLRPYHVNTGYTQFVPVKRIVLYRREEAAKVLTHELVHYMNIDTTILPWTDSLELDKRIAAQFRVVSLNGRLGCQEAICDLIGIWLWSAWKNCANGKTEADWAEDMLVQTDHIVSMAKRIMRTYRYSLTRGVFKENTHVFAYYILKAGMMIDPPLVQDIFDSAFLKRRLIGIEERMLRSVYSLEAHQYRTLLDQSDPLSLRMTR